MPLKIELQNGQKKGIEFQMQERIGKNWQIYIIYIIKKDHYLNLDLD